jgi:hypothetical protein
MNACTEKDPIKVKIEKRFEITFSQNKFKLKSKKYHKVGLEKLQISSTNLFKENQLVD